RRVGDGLLGVGDRRIVDDRRLLAAAGFDVTVDRVVAGVADAVGEPVAVDAGARIEHRLRLHDPVDLGRGVAPETVRIALPASIVFLIPAVFRSLRFSPAAIVARRMRFASLWHKPRHCALYASRPFPRSAGLPWIF